MKDSQYCLTDPYCFGETRNCSKHQIEVILIEVIVGEVSQVLLSPILEISV